MTDDAGNPVIEMLDGLRNEVAAFRREARDRLDAITTRLGYVERAVDRINSLATDTSGRVAATQESLDKLAARVERIERRLELDA